MSFTINHKGEKVSPRSALKGIAGKRRNRKRVRPSGERSHHRHQQRELSAWQGAAERLGRWPERLGKEKGGG